MKITAQNIAVLDDDKDGLLSRWVTEQGRLDHDGAIPVHYLKYIRPGDVVIDGGAAIGDHTIAYLRAVGPMGVVHAFEPSPFMLECLRYNCPSALIHAFALSDSEGTSQLHHDHTNAGASFLGPDRPGGIVVRTMRLDQLVLPRVNFIKLDLEGYEEKAISGARETLLRCRPKMVIEVSAPLLNQAGSGVKKLSDLLASLRYGWKVELGEMPTETAGRAEMYCYPLPVTV